MRPPLTPTPELLSTALFGATPTKNETTQEEYKMTRYTTRVELHAAGNDDYETLHSAMEKQGFSRFVKNEDGKSYHLPTAEYNFDGSATRSEVLEKAKTAAEKTRRKFEILVTESNGRSWHNLEPA
jgi:hypothetical protein